MKTTLIRNADWVVGWDDSAQSHCYLRNADVAFQGNTIIHVGPAFAGQAQEIVDGSELLVIPGLIDIHSHPGSEAMNKGFAEDLGNPRLGMSGLYDYMPVFSPDQDGARAAAEVSYSELLKSGVTTLVDLSPPYPGWLELIATSGLRGVLAPMHRSARWFTRNGHLVEYEWSKDGGRADFEAALEVVDNALCHESGRLSAMMAPSQIDTCTPELLAENLNAARQRKIPLHTHAAQSLVEFQEITRRHGVTPIRWLADQGMLTPETIIAHGIFLDTHSWISWGTRDDLDILADSGCSIAHCPNVFFRHGIMLEDFGLYRQAGINLAIGTDTFPHNMIEEIRAAALVARIASRRVEQAETADVFNAATIGGARALGRDDVGRLSVGAKADLVLVDMSNPIMCPSRDPLRSLIFTAADRAVRDVFVDGNRVVENRRVLTLDYEDASQRLQQAARRAEPNVAALDWGHRDINELSPPTFPIVD